MYTFLLMVLDFFKTYNLHFFMIFFIFIFVRWGIVFFNAIRYKPYKYDNDKLNFISSVIIPVVDEPLDLFETVLTKISEQKPSEIIVVLNGPENKNIKNLCYNFNTTLKDGNTPITFHYTPIAGKRNAIKEAMQFVREDSDISILVDSDTLWEENALVELLKPFACDEQIGGVTTRQKIINPERKLITMFANLLEEIRAEGTMKAMSVKGKVGCLPGRTIAFRTSILRDSIDEFMTETFMGIHKEVSDDRSLTNLTLMKGYKTVIQDTSIVYTDAPTKWKKFIKQQYRWASGSQYNNLKMTPWMFKNAKLMFFIYWSDMIMPMLLLSVYSTMIICQILKSTGYYIETLTYTEPWWLIIILILLGCIFSFGARNIKVMKNMKWYYTLLIPVFIFILTLIMVPIRLIGLMNCSDDTKWGTRNLEGNLNELQNT